MDEVPLVFDATRPVLVIDDDPDLVSILTESLIDEGIFAVGAHGGAEALAVASGTHPSLALIDYYLDTGDAELLIAQLRTACGDLPIVLLTGTAPDDLPELARRLRVSGTLPKPCSLDLLIETVTRLRR